MYVYTDLILTLSEMAPLLSVSTSRNIDLTSFDKDHDHHEDDEDNHDDHYDDHSCQRAKILTLYLLINIIMIMMTMRMTSSLVVVYDLEY